MRYDQRSNLLISDINNTGVIVSIQKWLPAKKKMLSEISPCAIVNSEKGT